MFYTRQYLKTNRYLQTADKSQELRNWNRSHPPHNEKTPAKIFLWALKQKAATYEGPVSLLARQVPRSARSLSRSRV